MVFQKPSLGTRVSFEMGMIHLGGQALYLSPGTVRNHLSAIYRKLGVHSRYEALTIAQERELI